MPFRTAASLLALVLGGSPALAQTGTPYNSVPAWTPVPATALQQTAFQPGGFAAAGARERDETQAYKPQVAPPGPERLFRLDTEAQVKERIRQENRRPGGAERLTFPEEPVVATERYNPYKRPSEFRPTHELVEPNYVCFHRTYFDQINAERYGWELGVLQPFIEVGKFYYDVAMLPYHMGTDPFRKCDSNAGYCLPGDPVPYLLYPPDINLTGMVAEAATVVGITFAFR
jgi:hypothetical protein